MYNGPAVSSGYWLRGSLLQGRSSPGPPVAGALEGDVPGGGPSAPVKLFSEESPLPRPRG